MQLTGCDWKRRFNSAAFKKLSHRPGGWAGLFTAKVVSGGRVAVRAPCVKRPSPVDQRRQGRRSQTELVPLQGGGGVDGHVQFDRGSRFCIEGRWARCSLMHYLSWSSWRGARYGLRCVGEASHPGPPHSDLRRLRTSRQGTPTANEIVEPTVADIEASVAGSNPLPTPSTVPCVSLTTAASAIETVALGLGTAIRSQTGQSPGQTANCPRQFLQVPELSSLWVDASARFPNQRHPTQSESCLVCSRGRGRCVGVRFGRGRPGRAS